jgi:hypothetical protein
MAQENKPQVVEPERSTFDKFVTGLSMTGSLTRQPLLDALAGKFRPKEYKKKLLLVQIY